MSQNSPRPDLNWLPYNYDFMVDEDAKEKVRRIRRIKEYLMSHLDRSLAHPMSYFSIRDSLSDFEISPLVIDPEPGMEEQRRDAMLAEIETGLFEFRFTLELHEQDCALMETIVADLMEDIITAKLVTVALEEGTVVEDYVDEDIAMSVPVEKLVYSLKVQIDLNAQ